MIRLILRLFGFIPWDDRSTLDPDMQYFREQATESHAARERLRASGNVLADVFGNREGRIYESRNVH